MVLAKRRPSVHRYLFAYRSVMFIHSICSFSLFLPLALVRWYRYSESKHWPIKYLVFQLLSREGEVTGVEVGWVVW